MKPNSEAAEIVNAYPINGGNYAKAIAALKETFADDELLIEVYSRELLGLKNKARDGRMTLHDLYKKILGHLNCLDTLGVTTDKCTSGTSSTNGRIRGAPRCSYVLEPL